MPMATAAMPSEARPIFDFPPPSPAHTSLVTARMERMAGRIRIRVIGRPPIQRDSRIANMQKTSVRINSLPFSVSPK